MRNKIFFYALPLLLAVGLWSCSENASPASRQESERQDSLSAATILDLSSLREDDELLAAIDIRIPYDLMAGAAREYRAISLEKVLRNHFGAWLGPAMADSLVLSFICKDGYAPSMPLKQALEADGYLAFKSHQSPVGQNWPDSLAEAYSPFYLVWEVPREEAAHYPWPYGLVQIRLQPVALAYADAYPKGSGPALAGFDVFRAKCLKCHSVNKVGGNMGQEFNYPKSLTEYWEKGDVKAFVNDPQSFRYNSEMTEHPKLTEEQFEALWDYLLYMKDHKLER
ncbi:MAG: c-type cytochrome [Phaeodactylibacter sp.]|nr:c-type cytochrome [Phaeodactylibacter sp.]MCB9302292.1 c-type cytochrome [Lewinellaceae bacterium]